MIKSGTLGYRISGGCISLDSTGVTSMGDLDHHCRRFPFMSHRSTVAHQPQHTTEPISPQYFPHLTPLPPLPSPHLPATPSYHDLPLSLPLLLPLHLLKSFHPFPHTLPPPPRRRLANHCSLHDFHRPQHNIGITLRRGGKSASLFHPQSGGS